MSSLYPSPLELLYRSHGITTYQRMTKAQWQELNAEYISIKKNKGKAESEPLGMGVSKFWWVPLWTEEKGTHPFFVPVTIHDTISLHTPAEMQGQPIEPIDKNLIYGMAELVHFIQEHGYDEIWEIAKMYLTIDSCSILLKAYRKIIWQFLK